MAHGLAIETQPGHKIYLFTYSLVTYRLVLESTLVKQAGKDVVLHFSASRTTNTFTGEDEVLYHMHNSLSNI